MILDLPNPAVKYIMDVLAARPYKEVAQLLDVIRTQIKNQERPEGSEGDESCPQ